MSTRMVIIGAGVSGLAAGIYGRMNGFDTLILEAGKTPGGCCSSWKRKAYTFDPCLHWVDGAAPGSKMNRIWKDLGALSGTIVVNHDELFRYRGDNEEIVFYSDIPRLRRHLLNTAPEDARAIEAFCADIERFKKLDLIHETSGTVIGALKSFSSRGMVKDYAAMTVSQLAGRFQNRLLREAIAAAFEDPRHSALQFLHAIALLSSRRAGYPIGGSAAFAGSLVKRYESLGGSVRYRSRVTRILSEGGRAAGVVLESGKKLPADIVIVASDIYALHHELLEGKLITADLQKRFAKPELSPPLITVSFGVKRDFSGTPYWVKFRDAALEESDAVADTLLSFQHFCFDPVMAPRGKSAVIVSIASSYEFWSDIGGKRAYEKEKQKLLKIVTGILEERFPGFKRQIEASDIATPLTWERHTGCWRGSCTGWLPGKANAGRRIPEAVSGMENLWRVGQWTRPGGGLAESVLSARSALEGICAERKRRFVERTAD
jgi:phytoene dehydrogenase-like protein